MCHTGLIVGQSGRIEAVLRTALRMVESDLCISHEEAIAVTGLKALHARRGELAKSFCKKTVIPGHRLLDLFLGTWRDQMRTQEGKSIRMRQRYSHSVPPKCPSSTMDSPNGDDNTHTAAVHRPNFRDYNLHFEWTPLFKLSFDVVTMGSLLKLIVV